jgi:hypothetical protein
MNVFPLFHYPCAKYYQHVSMELTLNTFYDPKADFIDPSNEG